MTFYCSEQKIKDFFAQLNQSGLRYVLLRNIDGELPSCLPIGKDIDLLFDYKQKNEVKSFLLGQGFVNITHPYSRAVYLYNPRKPEMYRDHEGVEIEAHYELLCKSTNAGEWMPLHQEIQKSCWENRFLCGTKFKHFTLSPEDELLLLIVRSVLDKRQFSPGYIRRIELLSHFVGSDSFFRKAKLVFFGYTPLLCENIKKKDYESPFLKYISFKEY